VNHFPGSGYITQKVDLATSGIPYIPVAFRIPAEVEKLLEYVSHCLRIFEMNCMIIFL
jgi:tubulin monoglycylase TTLL15